MADSSTINQPTFTAEEQIQLRNLEKQAQGFTNYRNLILRSLFSGQDSMLAAQLVEFLTQLINQTTDQAKQVNDSATQRANPPASAKEAVEEANSSLPAPSTSKEQ